MGSGKTYEVVSVVILGALAKGRRVVSNVAGLDYAAFVSLLASDGVSADSVGELVQVSHEQVMEEGFWLTEAVAKNGGESFIRPGDLLVLDEIWRFWGGFGDKAMPGAVMDFFRMHRHFVNSESGYTCDVALITQDVMDISRRVRAVIEETYLMTKLTVIGSSKRYRVDIYSGFRKTRSPLRSIQRTYNAKYFPLYSSHSLKKGGSADAREDNIDQRGNIFRGVLFKLVIPLCIPVFLVCVYLVWRFFNPSPSSSAVSAGAPAVNTLSGAAPGRDGGRFRSAGVDDGLSPRWRLVGVVSGAGGRQSWVLSDGSALRVVYDPPSFKFDGWSMSLELPEGDLATSWSGLGQGHGQVQGRGDSLRRRGKEREGVSP
jgi:zona occludens toxin